MLGEKIDAYFDFVDAYADLEKAYSNLDYVDLDTVEEELYRSYLARNNHDELTLGLDECYIDVDNRVVYFFLSDIEEVGIEDGKTVCVGYNFVKEEISVFEED